jgi:hypothetical protein
MGRSYTSWFEARITDDLPAILTALLPRTRGRGSNSKENAVDRAASWCGGALACAALGLLGLVLLGSGPASALGFSLQVYADGVRIDDSSITAPLIRASGSS